MSDLGPQDAGVEKRGRYGRKLRQLQKQLETALSNLQIAEEKHIYIMERAHVLSDLIATQVERAASRSTASLFYATSARSKALQSPYLQQNLASFITLAGLHETDS